MNLLDIIVIGILTIFAWISYRKGFLLSCFGFLPSLLALGASYLGHPFVSKFLRMTPLYSSFQKTLASSLDIENLIVGQTIENQTEFINNLNVPDFLKSSLIENNNSFIHDFLQVDKIQDYVVSFIANTCINIISVVLIFIVVFICARIFLSALNKIASLPVLNLFNKLSGLAVGVAQGLLLLWIGGMIITFFYYNSAFQPLIVLLKQSKIALMLYENNLLLFMILKVFV